MRVSAILLKISALAATFAVPAVAASAATVQYWAEGVSQTEGWVDLTQSNSSLCAPTCAADMLYWWQNRLSEKYVLPKDCPQTQYSIQAWMNDKYPNGNGDGGGTGAAMNEYIETFFGKQVLDLARPFSTDSNDLSTSATFLKNTPKERVFNYLFKNSLAEGRVVGIGSESHASVIWGIEVVDDTPTRAWIADPGLNAEENALEEYNIIIPEDNFVYFQRKKSDSSSSDTLQSDLMLIAFLIHDADFSPYLTVIPEPSAFPWLAGAGTLALVAARRRRRK